MGLLERSSRALTDEGMSWDDRVEEVVDKPADEWQGPLSSGAKSNDLGGFIVSLPWRWWTDHKDELKSSECMCTAGHNNLDLIVEGNAACALV